MGLGNWLVGKLGHFLTKDGPPRRGYLCDFDRLKFEVRPSDVLLVEGRNRMSRVVQHITHSAWSHAALYIGRLSDIENPSTRELVEKHYHGDPRDKLLIEAYLGEGVIVVPIEKYKNDHVRICRPTDISSKDCEHVIDYAAEQLGKQYNVRHFLDLGRFLLASRLIPGRWKSTLFGEYKPGQATQDICSVMIAKAFTAVQFPILPFIQKNANEQFELIRRNPRLFTPSDFDYSPYFNIIKYPFMPSTDRLPSYQTLPWNDDLVFSDERGVIEPEFRPDWLKEKDKLKEKKNQDKS